MNRVTTTSVHSQAGADLAERAVRVVVRRELVRRDLARGCPLLLGSRAPRSRPVRARTAVTAVRRVVFSARSDAIVPILDVGRVAMSEPYPNTGRM